MSVHGQVELDTLRAADPVRLHGLDALGPVDLGEVQQVIRVVRDTEEPLLQVALGDRRLTPPAAAIVDLLVGQDAVIRAPVDRRFLAVRQAALQELQEQPLIPAVVIRQTRRQLLGPVVRAAHGAPLTLHAADVFHRPRVGMRATLDGRALGGQAERVEAGREQHVEPLHPLVARVNVGKRKVPPVPQMQIAAGVREHDQGVVFGT